MIPGGPTGRLRGSADLLGAVLQIAAAHLFERFSAESAKVERGINKKIK